MAQLFPMENPVETENLCKIDRKSTRNGEWIQGPFFQICRIFWGLSKSKANVEAEQVIHSQAAVKLRLRHIDLSLEVIDEPWMKIGNLVLSPNDS